MTSIVCLRTRRWAYAVLGAVIVAAPAVAAVGDSPGARALAACDDIVDTTDSFSMNCVPTVIPDTSDQLTEAEVAEPGWNAVPGGGAGRR